MTITPKSRLLPRLALAVLAVGAALAAALFFKTPPPPVATGLGVVEQELPAKRNGEEILALVSSSAAHAVSGKALTGGVAHVRKAPGDAVRWVALGDLLAQAQRDSADPRYYDLAEMTYLQALEIAPQSAAAMAGMAWVTGGRHAFAASIRWAEQALALDAGNAAAVGILGDAEVELGDYDKAFEHYQRMMDLRPDLSSWSRGAHLLWLTGESDQAVALMARAIKAGAPAAENTAWCRANLATMLFHRGALDAAEQVLAPALAAASRNTHLLLAAGKIATARAEFPAARQQYLRILEAGPNHEALAALGDLSAREGDADAAEKYYAQVETLHAAGGLHDHMQMAKFYADHDRNLVAALRLAEQHKLTRNVLEADVLAWVYFKNGDLAHAAEAMQRALSRNTPDSEMHFHAGMIAAAAGDRVAAQQHLQQALGYNPQFSVLLAPVAVKTLDQLASAPAAVDAGPENKAPALP